MASIDEGSTKLASAEEKPMNGATEAHKRSIIYGTLATPIKKPDTDHTHRWTVFVKSGQNHPADNLTTYIKRISFKLHDSFAQPLRTLEEPPWEVNETGWGEFTIQIKIMFVDPNQRPITINHQLKLYPPEDMGQLKTSKPVLSQFYDEIVQHRDCIARILIFL
jgi:YEATS domain-containing protein 4